MSDSWNVMSDYWKDFCNYYGYNYIEESDDPYLQELIDAFEYYFQRAKFYMTYNDLSLQLGDSYSSITKKIPQYLKDGYILRFGSKKAEFVLQKYHKQYLDQTPKLDIIKLRESLEHLQYDWEKSLKYYITDLKIYLERLQIKVITPNKINFKCECNPSIISFKDTSNNFETNYKFLFYKSGKIIIHVDFQKAPIADLENLKVLFKNLRCMLLSLFPNANFMPPSFIFSQFHAYIKPYEDRPKQKINYNNINLSDLIPLLKGG
jgi:hypothetical protein